MSTTTLSAVLGELRALRTAARRIAAAIGQPGLEQEPERLAHQVAEVLECLRAERMPTDDELRALCRAAAGMSPDQRRRLRELAEAVSGDPESLECALNDIVGDALHRALGGVG